MTDRVVSGSHVARILGTWRASGPAYAALAASIRMLVLDGRLPLHTRMPAERQLAEALDVSRTTVTAAYEQLREEGYLRSRRGAGSWTALPADRRRMPLSAPWAPADTPGAPLLDLAQATLPAPEGALHQAVMAALDELPRHLPTNGYDLLGLPELRRAIADWYTGRGLPTSPDAILVTNGAQHAFDLILRLLIGPGDRVLVEHPTYPNSLEAVRRNGGRLVPVGLADDGWDLEMMRATLRQSAPRLAYLVPDFHNPTGLLMPDEARVALVELARSSNTLLIIDETLADLSLEEGPAPSPVAVHDRDGLVLSLGSMSKTFWGGLRIGWIRAAPGVFARLAELRGKLNMASPVLEQLVSAQLLPGLDKVVGGRVGELRKRRDAFIAALGETLPTWRVSPPAGGLSLWCELDAPVSSALVYAAEAHGLRLVAGPRFGVDGAFERFLRLPFTQPEPLLVDAVSRLAAAYLSVVGRPAAQERLYPVT